MDSVRTSHAQNHSPSVNCEPREACDAKRWRFLARPRSRSSPAGAAMKLLLLPSGPAPGYARGRCFCRNAPERPTKCCPFQFTCDTRQQSHYRDITCDKRQASSVSFCAARCAHSPYRRAQRAIQKSALRATLCSSLLQASGRSCKYLQQANADAAAPPRQPHRSPRRGPGSCAGNAAQEPPAVAPRATARAPVAPRSPHR